jgi:hypothetical protein
MRAMTEREACALLKARFEEAGFQIAENQPFADDGIAFELDGFDAARRVGYEYITEEAGDSWDVDGDVIAKLDERRKAGQLFILAITETAAPDAPALEAAARAFLASLPKPAKTKRVAKPKKPAAAKTKEKAKDKKPARTKRATAATR